MANNVVTLVLDVTDGAGAKIGQGSCRLNPSAVLADAVNNLYIPEAPVWGSLGTVSFATVQLIATDNAAPQPAGWAWTIQFPGVPGNPPSFSFFLPAAPQTFTATDASPCVFTGSGAGYLDNAGVMLSGGSLPAGFSAGVTYYVVNASGSSFELAATAGGTPLGSTSSGSGSAVAVQYYLSSLSPVSDVTTMAAYMPLPSGVPSAGQVPVASGSGDASAWATLTGRLLTDRGAIAASTAYNPGDMVAYQGRRVLITTATTSSTWPNWFTPPTLTAGTYIPITSQAVYYAADWGVVSDGTTDNAPALNRALAAMWGSGKGGFLVLPQGYAPSGSCVNVASTVIIPPGCFLVGEGPEVSVLRLSSNSNCDVVQFMTFLSDSQAAILSAATGVSISSGSLRNAFYSGLMNLTVHGNSGGQAATAYCYGVNMTTNPESSTAGTDPDFDPSNLLLNVEVRSCTGDGFYHFGRGQLRVTNCIFRYNQGWGVRASFDSLYTGNNFAENGLGGIYVPHSSCSGAASKSFNNGANAQWVSGSSYAALTPVQYNGAMYRAISALANDTTPPPSDPANWAHITSATAPAYWGYGYVFDTVAEESWVACDSQENAAGDFYLHNSASMAVQGTAANTNWQAASNPGNIAVVTLDGSSGNSVDVAYSQLNSLAYVLKVINGSTRCDVRMTGDTTYQGVLSPDTAALGGSGNAVRVSGVTLADGLLTTLGDLPYEGASGLARLPGNTASSRKFLTQTGTGTGSAAPAWNPIAAADVPATLGGTTFDGNVVIDSGAFSATPLISSEDGTATSHGALVHVLGGSGTESGHYILWYDATDPAYLGLAMALGAGLTYNGHPVIALGGYYDGWGVQGSSHDTGAAVFGVLNSAQSGRSASFRVDDNKTVATFNNTLDDGSGNAKVTGSLLIENGSVPASATFVGQSDAHSYSNFNLADGIYPLDQNPGGHYWAFSHRVSAHALEIFNYDGAGGYLTALQMSETGEIDTANNKLDDGAGNMTVSGALSVAGTKIPALVATTGDTGFALQNGTPAILTWTAPADGHKHRVSGTCMIDITSGETGGAVTYQTGQINGANIPWAAIDGGGNDVSVSRNQLPGLLIDPGSTVSLVQSSALTAGAATVWAELWAS